jgi:putative hydrolase of the HAD superfamily
MKSTSKALLFDLGNVLLPIDLDLTYKAFAQYSSKYSFEEIKRLTHELSLWTSYESGLQSEEYFRNFLKKELYLDCTDQEFDNAFNALLLQFNKDTYTLLANFKNHFSGLYLLSNTSYIHYLDYRDNELGPNNENLFDLFDELFFSFELGLVKPDAAIYKKVSESINKPLSEIIFFDDNEFNIESALNLGMDAHLIYPDNSIEQINQTLSAYVYE